MARTEVRGGQILDASVSLTADVTGVLPTTNGGTGASSITGAGIVDTSTAQTLTSKTLTDPKVNSVKDTSGNTIIGLSPAGSAVNYVSVSSGATGNSPAISAAGAGADLNLNLVPKGAGNVSCVDANFNYIVNFNTTTTPVNYVNFVNADTLNPPRLIAAGSDANVSLNLVPKGTGRLQANAVNVPTVSSTDTFTNKSISADQITGLTTGNTSQQSQIVVSATSYYVAGSNLTVPTNLAVGSRFRWTVAMAKTAAGTGAFAIEIRRGTAGTVADTADVSQSIGTQTAVVDNMTVDVEVVVTTTGATGAYYWTIIPTNKAASATGFGVAVGPTAQFSGTVSSVAMNTASLKFGLSFKATTGTPTITVPMVRSNSYV